MMKEYYPWLPREVIVKIGSNVELQQLRRFCNNMRWSPILFLLLKIFIVFDDHSKLMCEIILQNIRKITVLRTSEHPAQCKQKKEFP